MMKSKWTPGPGRILAIVVVGLLLAVGTGFLFPGEYTTEQTMEWSFVIDENFTKVRKIMVRTNAAKEIVTMGGDSEFLEQRWKDGDAQLNGAPLGAQLKETQSNGAQSNGENSPNAATSEGGGRIGRTLLRNVLSQDPDWKIELQGTLKIRTLNDTIGKEVIELEQEVEIDPDQLQSQVELSQGTPRLLGYTMSTKLVRAGMQTQVVLNLKEKIKIPVPWFAHSIADRRVRASIQETLENQGRAMRQLIEENADKAGLFPLR